MSLKTLFRHTEAPTRREYPGKATVLLTKQEENLATGVAAQVILYMSPGISSTPKSGHEVHELDGFRCTLATHAGLCWSTCEITNTFVVESENRNLIYRIAQLIEEHSAELQTTTRDAMQEDPFCCTITLR